MLLTNAFSGEIKKKQNIPLICSESLASYKCDKARARSFKVSINSHQFDLRREDYIISK